MPKEETESKVKTEASIKGAYGLSRMREDLCANFRLGS